ncbi:surface-adhesin E family protein [Paraburkholderia dipogonis]|uniref:surface-adhesin E family protein n=1 Tax=Paraburkholderia dipogonis TaxID=1211383 RepID=UPI0038B7A1A8
MKKQLLALALLSVAGFAHATDWQNYGESSTMTIFVAADRLTRTGDYVETWQKFAYAKLQHEKKKPYSYSISQITVHCNASVNSMRFRSVTYYAPDGGTVDSVSGDGPWSDVVPDSVADFVTKRVCQQ